MKNQTKGALIAAAVATLFAGGVVLAGEAGGKKTEALVKCVGGNDCKGKGACAGGGHDCAGRNECKGKGYIETSAEDCKAKGGTVGD